jgi:hypothetical protein
MLTLSMRKTHARWTFWLLRVFATIAGAVAYILMMGLISAGLAVMVGGSNPSSATNGPEPGFLWFGVVLAVLSMAAMGMVFGFAQ